MKIGKISETVLKRSVLKQLTHRRDEVKLGAVPGEDCAVLAFESGEQMLVSAQPAEGLGQDAVLYGLHRAINNIAAEGGEPVAVLLSLLLPASFEERELKAVMAQAEAVCGAQGVQIAGGHTAVTDAVNRPVVTATAVGKAAPERILPTGGARPGADLVVTKWVALEGTAVAAKEKEAELLKRFPAYLVEEAKGFDRYLSVLPEARIAAAAQAGVQIQAMTDVSGGGIFAALWKLAEGSRVGLEVELKKLPIRQETVEICNFLDLNPYGLASSGSLLVAAKDGAELARLLERNGIPACVVGRTTEGNDRIIRNGEEKRFLERV